jgi:c-di-AMP phosphodiesterase-like protein
MGKNIYLYEDNAEETLSDVVELIKKKATLESRIKAFEDCTEYWTKEVLVILKDNCPNGAKVSRIRQLFNIKPLDD